jgi:hypothetical protein
VTRVILAWLALVASLVQVGAIPSLFLDTATAPLLPVAVIAAWGAVRGPDDLWAGILVAPLPLALASEERVGWFLLALLPTAALLLRRPPPDTPHQLLRAPLAAALGSLAYLVVLFCAGGAAPALPGAASSLLGAATLTALVAALFALVLWPARTRRAPGFFR